MTTKDVLKNILPAIAIMMAGLAGAYLVYNTYFIPDQGAVMSTMAPAAGDEAAKNPAKPSAEDNAAETDSVDPVQTPAPLKPGY